MNDGVYGLLECCPTELLNVLAKLAALELGIAGNTFVFVV